MRIRALFRPSLLLGTMLVLVVPGGHVFGQDAPPPTDKEIQYSPYPQRDFPNNVYFGDTRLHTAYSTDAGMVGCTLGPEDAYRFARGETVLSSTGVPARLNRPYDFLVVTDHSLLTSAIGRVSRLCRR